MTHILLVYQKLIPSAVLCGHTQLTRLAEKGRIEYRHAEAYHVTSKLLKWADTVIFIRGALEMDLLVAQTAKKAGKKLVYALDDDLFNVPSHIDSASFYNNPKIRRNMNTIMSLCDIFVTPSRNLMEKYGERFSRSALIEEPALEHKTAAALKNDKIKICFAGSLDRTNDIEQLLKDVIERLVKTKGSKISVTFFGAKPEFVDTLGLNYIEYQNDYADYISVMCAEHFDIGLAPMLETVFSSCKHYNKYIEYASFGIAGVYSDTVPYTYAVRNGENGLLCSKDPEEWYSAVSSLVDSPELLEGIKAKCIEEAETVYSLDRVSDDYAVAVEAEEPPAASGGLGLFAYKRCFFIVKYFIARCLSFAKRTVKFILNIK